jgi:peptidoglycan-N-acetylglucosamine deacetylase
MSADEVKKSYRGRLSVGRVIRRALRPVIDLFGGLRRKYYGPITQVRTTQNLVALTFDDGPHPEFTIALLDILAAFGAKATFFMVGRNAARYPDIVKEVINRGHVIGNHSYSHPSFPHLSSKARLGEIQRCEAAVGRDMAKLFRPPFGAENAFCHHDALQLGYRIVNWSISLDDWGHHSAEWIADSLLRQLRPGSIVLLHDNVVDDAETNRRETLEAVRHVLNAASGRFEFCTLPDLLAAGTSTTSFRAA